MSPATAEAVVRLGSFELMTRIAKGGMAEIFLARQANVPGFERLVVVKRILPQLAEEPAFVRMFLEEARLAALINHPNVVQIHDVGVQDGQYFIAMEHISGVTVSALARAARREGRLVSAAGALEIAAQACAGLSAAHELHDVAGNALGVVHRDVTPQNLMVTRAGLVKVLDFGIAKATARTKGTEVGTLKGKYPYMSPEQVRAEPVDARSDLFSLGTVVYELLTGQSPFERPSELQTLNAVDECRVPPPSRATPHPAEVDRFVLRALAREPADRFETAAAMGAAAREALEAMGLRSSTELLRAEVVERFGTLFTAQQTAVEDAVSSVRTRIRTVSPGEDATRVEGPSRPRPAERTWAARALLPAAAGLLVLAGGTGLAAWWAGALLGTRAATSAPADTAAPAPARPTATPMPAVLTGPPLRLGTPPFIPADLLAAEAAPLVEYLSRRLGRPVTLAVGADYEEVAARIASGELDVAKLTPLQYIRAKAAAPGLRLLAIQTYDGSSTYEGYLVTLDGVGLTSVEDLRGRRPCWVEPGSASGYLLPRTFLRRQGLDPDRDLLPGVSSGDHVAVLRDLLAGKCEVGAIASGTLLAARDLSIPVGRVRVLAATGELPLDAFVASPSLPEEDALRVQSALVSLDTSRDLGIPFIGRTLRIGGFLPGRDAQFDTLRAAAAADAPP